MDYPAIKRNQIWVRSDGGPYDGMEVKVEATGPAGLGSHARIIFSKRSEGGKGPRSSMRAADFRVIHQLIK